MSQENVVGKIQTFNRCYDLTFVLSCATQLCVRIRLWPLRRDFHCATTDIHGSVTQLMCEMHFQLCNRLS